MDLKTIEVDGKTYAEVKDNKPVYVDDGKEIAFDASSTVATISRLNSEAKGHRERAQAAENSLKAFEGIEDPGAALKALETVRNLDDKKLVDAGEVDKVKAAAIKAVEERYAPIVKERDDIQAQLRQEKIGGSFARSKFISDQLTAPSAMVEKTFGDRFTIEDGRVVAKDQNGNLIYSKSNPGEVAGFDEAMEIIVSASPYRDDIMVGRKQTGTGAKPSNGGVANRTMSRSEFDALGQADRASKAREGVKIVDA